MAQEERPVTPLEAELVVVHEPDGRSLAMSAELGDEGAGALELVRVFTFMKATAGHGTEPHRLGDLDDTHTVENPRS